MASWIEIPIVTDPAQLEEDVYAELATRFPGWEAADGNLETHIVKALTQTGAALAEVAVQIPPEIFHNFGEKIVSVPPLAAAPAQAETTWTMVDDAGYTIPVGTLVEIVATGDETFAFRTVEEIQVVPGSTATGAGEVAIEAVIEGEAANDLDANPTLIDSLDFVSSIAIVGATSGGVDAEDPFDYLDRLAAEMRLLSTRPILPEDVETLVRRVAGVGRAVAIDGYDAIAETTGNERMVTVAVASEEGAALSAGIKDDVDALLEAEREVNFVFHVIDPTSTTVKASTTAVALPGFDPAAVETAIETALTDFLSPANWGRDAHGIDPFKWRNITVVRRNDLIALVDNVEGVDYVTALDLAEESGVLGTADVTLAGPAPLPAAGTISATVS